MPKRAAKRRGKPGRSKRPKMELSVEIKKAGPCKKHVHVRVPRAEIDRFYEDTVKAEASMVAVPGFRPGHVPIKLVEKRFRSELAAKVKQRVLLESMEQLSTNEDLDPINEPDLDVESIELPEEGDFEYEFDVEVRPEFDLPNYEGLTIERPIRELTDADVDKHVENFLSQYGQLFPTKSRSKRATWLAFRSSPATMNKSCWMSRRSRCGCVPCSASRTPSSTASTS